MLSEPSSCERREITVNRVVPTSGSLLWKCTLPVARHRSRGACGGRKRLEAAGERMHAKSGLAQRAGGGEAAFARCANEQILDPGTEQFGVGEQRGHGDVPGGGGR